MSRSLIPFLLAFSLSAPAQPHDHAVSQADLKAKLTAAFERMQQSQKREQDFTRFRLEHNRNLAKNGRVLSDHTQLLEDLWIHNLPYERLVEKDGRPLDAAAHQAEDTRYEKTLSEHQALDSARRVTQDGGHSTNLNVDATDILGPDYILSSAGEHPCGDTSCLVIESTPAPHHHPYHRRWYELWLNQRDGTFTRMSVQTLADEDDIRKGATFVFEFELFDGVPVLQHTVGQITLNSRRVRVITENTYSRYRKFSTSATVLPTTAEPPADHQP